MGRAHNIAIAGLLTVAQGCSAPGAETHVVPKIGSSAICTVERISDGDTFVCRSGDRVRLLLIDTPELAQRSVGESAKRALSDLLPLGRTVRLDFDVDLRDQYDRLLAYAYRGDLFINREMARRGMAVALVIPPNVKYVEVIRAAVDSARNERRGLWRTDAFSCSPQDFRAGRCGK